MHPKLPEFADILWGTGVLYQVKLLGSKGLMPTGPGSVIISTVPSSGRFQLSNLMSYRFGLGFGLELGLVSRIVVRERLGLWIGLGKRLW